MRRPAIIKPQPPSEPGDPASPLWKRLAWFAGLAAGSALVTAVIAYALRALPFVGAP